MLSQSMEDYLEAITVLKKKKGVARVKDISAMLNVKNPSVVSAIALLTKKGYVKHEPYGYIELTPSGEEKADIIHKKHNVIVDFLTSKLKVPSDIAKQDACKIEHVISKETYKKIIEFMD